MNITQKFYDNLATQYDKLFFDWQSTTKKQAQILNKIFCDNGFNEKAKILDCSCGIGTQAIGLASLGYKITASDISYEELAEAKKRADRNNVKINFTYANFCNLSEVFDEKFDIIISIDNALPHMLSQKELETAIKSITNQISNGGMFVASIRDYDSLIKDKPPYSPPYIHKTNKGQRVCFQTWEWNDDCYKQIQYIIDDENTLQINKFVCEYRAILRDELSKLLISNGCNTVKWLFPEKSGFYQPIVIAKK